MTPPPTVEILAIGNELLRGEILDTNTQWLCRLVTARGGRVGRVTLLADVETEIAAAVSAAIERGVAVLFTSGGLGPTDDDLTLAAVARGAGVELVLNEQARAMVRASYDDFHARGIIAEPGLNPFREKMARLPAGAEPLLNPVGTAPGVLLHAGGTAIISLPGVPPELEAIVSRTLAPFLDRTFGSGASASRLLTVRCNDESIMAPALTGVVARHPRVYIKSLARALGEVPELDILLLATGGDPQELQSLVDAACVDLCQGLDALSIPHRPKAAPTP